MGDTSARPGKLLPMLSDFTSERVIDAPGTADRMQRNTQTRHQRRMTASSCRLAAGLRPIGAGSVTRPDPRWLASVSVRNAEIDA